MTNNKAAGHATEQLNDARLIDVCLAESRKLTKLSMETQMAGVALSNIAHAVTGVATVGFSVPISICTRLRTMYVYSARSERCKDDKLLAIWTMKRYRDTVKRMSTKRKKSEEKKLLCEVTLSINKYYVDCKCNDAPWKEPLLCCIAMVKGDISDATVAKLKNDNNYSIVQSIASLYYTCINKEVTINTGVGIVQWLNCDFHNEMANVIADISLSL